MNGGSLTDRIYLPVAFIDTADLDASISADGSIQGIVVSQGIQTPFSFPSRVMDARGNSLALRSYMPCIANHLAFDDFIVEAQSPVVAQPSFTPTSIPSLTPTPSHTAFPTSTPTRTPTPTPTFPVSTSTCCVAHVGAGCAITA